MQSITDSIIQINGLGHSGIFHFMQSITDSIIQINGLGHSGIFLLGDFNDRRQTWSSDHNSELKNELFDLVTSMNIPANNSTLRPR